MFKILSLIVFACSIIGSANAISPNNKNVANIEKDYAIGEDYIDISERMNLVLDTTGYSSGLNTYVNYKTSFFDNLTYNFGMNYKGSCGYIAIAMLLSYYDNYLSDSIIPEQYDINSIGQETNMISRRNSPGVLKDIIGNPTNPSYSDYGYYLSANAYYSSISSMSSSSLHAKLISIGAARGYYDFSDDDNPCGTNYSIRYNVMQDYFSNVLGYTYGNQYTFSSYNGESSPSLSDNVRNFAISQVSAGNPVLLSIGKATGGHVVVAYDYDASTDKLYCHMGWNASTTHSTIESQSYTRYKTALAINFNFSHGHSNNYGVTTIDNNAPTTNFYCYHDCHISTYSNSAIHSYTDHYALHSSEKHKAYCACGDYVLEPHVVEVGSTHTFHGHTYANCIDCGALVDLGTTIVIGGGMNNQDLLMTDNGSYVLPNGILIIVEDDLKDYFSDTLVFHRREDAIV